MKLKQELILREVGGESILIPVTSLNSSFNGIIALNETGVLIWKLIEAGKEKPEITEALLAEYDVSREKAEQDVDKLCGQFEQLGIL